MVTIDLDVMQNQNYPTTSTLTFWMTVQMSYDGQIKACAVALQYLDSEDSKTLPSKASPKTAVLEAFLTACEGNVNTQSKPIYSCIPKSGESGTLCID